MSESTNTGPVMAADGTPLKRSLARALRRQKLRALMLIAPLLLFIMLTFILPVADMLFRSVENGIVEETLPTTVVALANWDAASGELPDEAVYAAMAVDLKAAAETKTHTRLASRLNYETPGMSSLFRKAGRTVKKWDVVNDGPYKEKFLDLDKDWGDVENWQTIQTYSPRLTPGYYLNAVDMQVGPDGAEMRPESERIYLLLFKRTMYMSLMITISCIALGYPVAWLLANLPMRAPRTC